MLMSRIENRDYYNGRQRQEEAAAGVASNPAARQIHQELAACYEARAGAPQAMDEECQTAAA